MRQYLDLLDHILTKGVDKEDRTGVGTKSVLGYQMRFDLAEGFPLMTTKKIHLKSIIHELLWFLSGSTNVRYLQQHGVTIWDEWADEQGELGPVYGYQWRSWPTRDGGSIDQISQVIERIRTKPDDRRLLVTAWNPEDVPKMKLPPCHCLFQFWTRELSIGEKLQLAGERVSQHGADFETYASGEPSRALSCQLYQRSCDIFLGVPFNIASYALLTIMVAQVCGMAPDEFVWVGGDVHLYRNHLDQTREQLTREPRPLPQMLLNPEVKDIFEFRYEDFQIVNYNPHPAIKAPIAV